MLIHRGAWRLPSGRSAEPSPAPRRPSFADGDRQPYLGYVGDRHLEEIVQDSEGSSVPWSVGHRVVTPTIQGEGSVPRWSAFADVDGKRPGRIGGRLARARVPHHIELPCVHIALGHEVQQAVEAAELQGPEQWPVAPRVARAYVYQDEAPGVVGGPGVEHRPLGVAQRARVVVGDDHTAGDPTLELVELNPLHLTPSKVLLCSIPDLIGGWRCTQHRAGGLDEG